VFLLVYTSKMKQSKECRLARQDLEPATTGDYPSLGPARRTASGDLIEAVKAYELWTFLAWQDIRIRYRRSTIGPLWITISMAVFCGALGAVYSQLFKINMEELLPYLAVGFVIWTFIASSLGEMPNLLVENAAYIKDIRINPLSIVLRSMTRNVIILVHNLLIVAGIYLYFGIWPGWVGLAALPGLALVTLNLLAIGTFLSILGARYRDIAQITQSALQVLFFITPVIWLPRLLPEGHWVIAVNPAAHFLDLTRSPMLGTVPALTSWLISLGVFVLAAALAAFAYRRKATRIPFWI
jgi:ABC-type polysaccharide/polyol phosphate export permease